MGCKEQGGDGGSPLGAGSFRIATARRRHAGPGPEALRPGPAPPLPCHGAEPTGAGPRRLFPGQRPPRSARRRQEQEEEEEEQRGPGPALPRVHCRQVGPGGLRWAPGGCGGRDAGG